MSDETNSNDNNQITDIVPQNEIDDIFTSLTDKDPKGKQYKFYLYYLFGFPIKTCAKKAGYAESTGYAMVQKYKKVSKLRRTVDEILNLFPERYKSVCKLRLPQVAEIEGKALQEYEKDPKLVISKPQLLRQVKMGAGVIGDDEPVRPDLKTVTVRVQQIFAEVQNQKTAGNNPQMLDDEIIEVESSED